VNVYAIEDGDGVTLIDAGWAIDRARQQLERALAELGYALRDITQFLITHLHRDHYTQAVAIRRELRTPIALGADEQPSLDVMPSLRQDNHRPQITQLRVAGAAAVIDRLRASPGDAESPLDWEAPDVWITGQAALEVGDRRLIPIPTPGHTRGHLVFADRENGILFAGDHVLPHITPSVGFEAAPQTHPLRNYLRSLELVRTLPDMRLLPAHGPVTDSVHARVDELLGHHDVRLQDCVDAVRAGAGTAYETARRLRWTRREHHFDDLDAFNQMLAAIETLIHLELLAEQGRLGRGVTDGTATFEPPVDRT
jgi:glyoxylase-like metal-dependent hydrolase (beta-lactamase superfamily II)